MQKKTVNLSVVLATFNEEEHLPKCLESVKDNADEIVVVDGRSTDDTQKIAKKFGARVISTTNKPMFHTNKQMAIDKAKGSWILQLDADEEVDDELKQFIRKLLDDGDSFEGYWIKRKNFFLGRFLTKGGQYPDPVIRLFKHGKGSLPQKSVHEQIQIDGQVGWAEGHLMHYNAPTFSRYIDNANRYTSLTATELKSKKVSMNFFNDLYYMLIKPLITFIQIYFRHRGYKDGFPGFVFALFSGIHHALAYMKLGDLYRYESSH